jgi:uncharacterized membrane protein YhaH (DUF805 family)
MKMRSIIASTMRWVLVLAVVPASAGSLLAQDDRLPARLPAAAMGGFFAIFLVLLAALYVYMALALQTIATKTNTENPWLAWIPIVNLLLLVNIAKKPIWWFILFFIPLVGIVIAIIVWMGVAEARGKPNWWGVLLIIPLVGLIVPGYLAWSD